MVVVKGLIMPQKEEPEESTFQKELNMEK